MNEHAFRNPDPTARPASRPIAGAPRVHSFLLAIGLASCIPAQLCAQSEAGNPFFTPGADPRPGSEIFLTYCAGCHGFDGFAAYEHAPSFSMGERLHKRDAELLRSVLDGKHAMPYWKHKLSDDMVLSAIGYLREMDQRYKSGNPPRAEPLPDIHYKFKPVGEDDDYWLKQQRAE